MPDSQTEYGGNFASRSGHAWWNLYLGLPVLHPQRTRRSARTTRTPIVGAQIYWEMTKEPKITLKATFSNHQSFCASSVFYRVASDNWDTVSPPHATLLGLIGRGGEEEAVDGRPPGARWVFLGHPVLHARVCTKLEREKKRKEKKPDCEAKERFVCTVSIRTMGCSRTPIWSSWLNRRIFPTMLKTAPHGPRLWQLRRYRYSFLFSTVFPWEIPDSFATFTRLNPGLADSSTVSASSARERLFFLALALGDADLEQSASCQIARKMVVSVIFHVTKLGFTGIDRIWDSHGVKIRLFKSAQTHPEVAPTKWQLYCNAKTQDSILLLPARNFFSGRRETMAVRCLSWPFASRHQERESLSSGTSCSSSSSLRNVGGKRTICGKELRGDDAIALSTREPDASFLLSNQSLLRLLLMLLLRLLMLLRPLLLEEGGI